MPDNRYVDIILPQIDKELYAEKDKYLEKLNKLNIFEDPFKK